VTRALVLPLVGLLAAGCIPEEGPLMDPGRDCRACHGGGGGGGGEGDGEEGGPPWTFAGTVFPALTSDGSSGVRGVRVHATDATGRTVTVVSNEAGNFYIRDGLTFPLHVALERDGRISTMEEAVSYGGCNGCHAVPPDDGARGRLVAP
jgi:hypothetical protein